MANTIEYNGYIGSIEYSSEDKCFFGKVEMINDLVTFEATSADELESNLQASVDEYIQTCKKLDREPQKTFKGVFNVRLDPELHQKIYKEALRAGVSINAFIKNALKEQVSIPH